MANSTSATQGSGSASASAAVRAGGATPAHGARRKPPPSAAGERLDEGTTPLSKAKGRQRAVPFHIRASKTGKPGSVSGSHLSTRRVAAALQPPRSGRPTLGREAPAPHTGVAPDSLQRRTLSSRRCALTAPFPPFPHIAMGSLFLLHFSSDRSGRALPVILALWSPDFPHSKPFGFAARPPVLLRAPYCKGRSGQSQETKICAGKSLIKYGRRGIILYIANVQRGVFVYDAA